MAVWDVSALAFRTGEGMKASSAGVAWMGCGLVNGDWIVLPIRTE